MPNKISLPIVLVAGVLALAGCGGGSPAGSPLHERLERVVSEAPDGAYERIDSSGPISADEFASGDADARAVLVRAGFQGAFGNRWKSETAQGEATALAFALRDAAGAAGWLRFLRAQQDAAPGASQRELELGDEGWEVRAEEGDVQVSILGWRHGRHVLIATIARFGRVDRADVLAWARSIDARAAEAG